MYILHIGTLVVKQIQLYRYLYNVRPFHSLCATSAPNASMYFVNEKRMT